MAEFREKDPEKWKDYKLILGNEIYLCSRKVIEEDKDYVFYHFILIAKDEVGHKQIRELSTRAWIDNSFTWVNIRTPTYYDDLFEVVEANRGHLVASTGCLGGFAPKLILQAYKENPSQPDYHKVRKWLSRMDQCFGHGNFFLELQPSIQEEQKIVNLEDNQADRIFTKIIAGLCWLFAVLLSAILFIVYRTNVNKESLYSRKLKKILNTYDSIIVNVETLPKTSDLSVVNVTTFEELVDAQMEVRLPINFKEDTKKHIAKFVLVRNNLAWIYTLEEGNEGEK